MKAMKFVCKFSVSFVFSLVIFVALSSAQADNSSLRGTITDQSGSSVPDANITIESSQLGLTLTAKSDKLGAYQFVAVRPATYTLTVTATGFATYKQTGLQLLVSTPTTVDIKMELASVATTVEVATTQNTINTTDATIGNAFNQTQISSLPFEGRDPVAILSLQPGVTNIADRGQVDPNADSRGGAVNGARSDQTNLTLDGVDNNDQTHGYAFTGAVRATLDSIEEFRVTTTNSSADQGRSSGAQVALVTKSGTNQIHGTAYEYNRPTNTVANDYFNKHSELQNGEPNKPAHLLRNTFGGSFGGAFKKDRAYYFLAYEGQRTRENTQITREVPSDALRDGVIQYLCENPSACPGGSVQGQSGATYNFAPGYNALGPTDIATMDPNCASNPTCTVPGVNPAILATLNLYPHANSNQLGDGFNYRAFTFSSPSPNKQDTYVARFDYNLNQSGGQRLFARLGLQNDHANLGEWFPGQPASEVDTNNSKSILAGYLWTLSPTKVNNFHYGFVRQGVGQNGTSREPFVYLRGLATATSNTRTTSVVVPVHNFTDDFSWTKGKHTFQFGGNYRLVTNSRTSDANSFSDGITNTGFLGTTSIQGSGSSFDPAAFGFPAVDGSFGNSYDYPMLALVGAITEVDTVYVQNKGGQYLDQGSFVPRNFRDNELEFYGMDTWRIKNNLTLTYGLRYSLLEPPYETNGNQVTPSISLDDFFRQRISAMDQGDTFNPDFSFDLGGRANGKPGYWGWDKKNFAPRVSLAWSPGFSDGLLGAIFGGPGKSSVRVGAGMYYDHFGQGIVNTFDRNGSFGFVTSLAYPPGTVDIDSAPRYTGPHDIPPSLEFPQPPAGFPQTPPDAFAIYWGLDDKLKTPYSYAFDLSVSRELKGGFVFEAAYVGRLGRRLLQEKDLAQPENLFDKASGLTYFQALTALAKVYRSGLPTQNFDPSMVSPQVAQFWNDVIQPLQPGGAYLIGAGSGNGTCGNLSSTTSPLVAAYDLFCGGSLNETTPLYYLDQFGFADANIPDTAYYGKNGLGTFYQSQFASLYAWTSTGRSNYNALQLMLRHRASHGFSWDFNYSYSRSIDMGSDAERVSLFEGYGFGGGQIINPFEPGQFRGVSDYDMTHQINTNWVYELPFGKHQKWGQSWGRALDAIAGGWSWSGLGKWSSGLPFSIQNGFEFPTNWELNGLATLTGRSPKTGVFTDVDGDPNMFQNAGTALAAFDFPFPGESGSRNVLRGPGYFSIDTAVRKSWNFTERAALSFSAEAFNVTNSVRFDAANAFPTIDSAGSFGKYSNTLTRPRVMEFALRFSF